MRERITMKYFYTTGSNCTSSLAAVDACISQSKNNIIHKYLISSSASDPDFYPSASRHEDFNSTRMSEAYGVKNENVPILVVDHYGEAGIIGMEVTRWPEKSKYLHTQDNINALFNHYSSSTG
jgi:hypothetical protein